MLVTCRQMQEWEERAFAAGVSAAALMEEAGWGIARAIRCFFPQPGTLGLYLGTGNNAGDALVAARELRKDGWQVWARMVASTPEKMKPLPKQHWQTLSGMPVLNSAEVETRSAFRAGPLVLLDGLLGIGSQGPLRPELAVLAVEMNALRLQQGAFTVAMDIPSGLDGDTGRPGENAVYADLTVTIGQPKQGLVSDSAIHHVGRLALVPLAALEAHGVPTETQSLQAHLLTPSLVQSWLPRRDFDFHKGMAGRVGIVAGSPGFYGAAELACLGALRAGAGLVTLLVKPAAYDVLVRRVPPEVMVRTVQNYSEILESPWDALAIGPGLGFENDADVIELIRQAPMPAVVDADALTLLARMPSALENAIAPRVLTPHPGEMKRLMPDAESYDRSTQARRWAAAQPSHTLLLKGARTVIATEGQPLAYNSTGHPGMATGGMGDVLSGIIAALLGQGLSPHTSACLGAWLSGRAAECHAMKSASESTLPTDVVAYLGSAWQGLRQGATA